MNSYILHGATFLPGDDESKDLPVSCGAVKLMACGVVLISIILILPHLPAYRAQSPPCAPLIVLDLQMWGAFLVLLRLASELVLICETSCCN